MTSPTIDRPIFPEGYGIPESDEGILGWDHVESRLLAATEFWMASTRPDGRPHVVPRWGVWVEGHFYYDGSPQTRHVQNILKNPNVVLHLESGTDVVIIEGTVAQSTPVGPELGKKVSDEFKRKYAAKDYTPEPDAWSGEDAGGLCVFTPKKAMVWSSFPTDATRFTFGG